MQSISPIDIRSIDKQSLEKLLKEWGEPAFRSKQIFDWIWNKSLTSFDGMKNIPEQLRRKLNEAFQFQSIEIHSQQKSTDGTIKCGFSLHDKRIIESVLIPTDTRMTACVSSQVGCSLSCKFCATGQLARERNLSAGEIYDQVVGIKRLAEAQYQKPLTNIVFMGMGEPLLNYTEVTKAIHYITNEEGLGMSADRITLSTAGISKMIQRLADDGARIKLALSLHAANDRKRDSIMPINESNNLDVLREALLYYYKGTGKRITLEYLMLDQFNDQISDAKELAQFCKRLPVKVNLIEYNSTDGNLFRRANSNQVEQFKNYLENNRIIATIRHSRGKDIDAACGQLANKVQ